MINSSDNDDYGQDFEDTGDYTANVKLFIGQIPKDLDEKNLIAFFSKFGNVAELRVIRDKSNQVHKGCAFLTYVSPQSALAAIEELHDRIKLPGATNPLQVRIAESQAERENKLFIGMLPKTINEEDLQSMFIGYGDLREVHIIRGPEGSSKGCAFVKFVDREAAMVAIEDMNDVIPAGSTRPLVVKFADSKKQPPARSGKGESQLYETQMPSPPLSPLNPSVEWMGRQQQQQQQLQTFSQSSTPISLPFMALAGADVASSSGQYVQSPGAAYSYQTPFASSIPPPSYQTSRRQPSQQSQHQRGKYSTGSRQMKASGVHQTAEVGVNNFTTSAGYQLQDTQFDSAVTSVRNTANSSSSSRPPEGPMGANLFIYHLPRDLTDADLATLFAPFGNVISAKVFVDKKTSDSKGFGFVSYDQVSSADTAITSMNGFQIGTKRLKVQHKRTSFEDDGLYQALSSMSIRHQGQPQFFS